MTPCSFGEPGSMIQVVIVPEGLPPDELAEPLSSSPPQPTTTSAALTAHAANHRPAFIASSPLSDLGAPSAPENRLSAMPGEAPSPGGSGRPGTATARTRQRHLLRSRSCARTGTPGCAPE